MSHAYAVGRGPPELGSGGLSTVACRGGLLRCRKSAYTRCQGLTSGIFFSLFVFRFFLARFCFLYVLRVDRGERLPQTPRLRNKEPKKEVISYKPPPFSSSHSPHVLGAIRDER